MKPPATAARRGNNSRPIKTGNLKSFFGEFIMSATTFKNVAKAFSLGAKGVQMIREEGLTAKEVANKLGAGIKLRANAKVTAAEQVFAKEIDKALDYEDDPQSGRSLPDAGAWQELFREVYAELSRPVSSSPKKSNVAVETEQATATLDSLRSLLG